MVLILLWFFLFTFFFFKQKTAYEMRISDWSSDVCSSDLLLLRIVVRKSIGLFDLRRKVVLALHAGEIGVAELRPLLAHFGCQKIGRASCRERVCQYV